VTKFISHCDEVDEGSRSGQGCGANEIYGRRSMGRNTRIGPGLTLMRGLLCRQWSGCSGEEGVDVRVFLER
jgi:hypothetical protein